MKQFVSVICLAILICVSLFVMAENDKKTCLCPLANEGWVALNDSTPADLMPEFLWSGEPLSVGSLLYCEHGLFFFFTQKNNSWCFGIPAPSRERYQPYVQPMAIDSLSGFVDPVILAMANDLRSYENFVLTVGQTLGRDLAKGLMVDLKDQEARLELGKPITFVVKDARHEIYGIPEIYYRQKPVP